MGFDYTREDKAKANAKRLDRVSLEHIVATVTRWLDNEDGDQTPAAAEFMEECEMMLESFDLFTPEGKDEPAANAEVEYTEGARELDVALVLPVETAVTPQQAVDHFKRMQPTWPVRLYEIRDQESERLLWMVSESADAEGTYDVEAAE